MDSKVDSKVDSKMSWPAPERNKGPILEVLRAVLLEPGVVLEIACGTGQHAAHFARHLPHVIWQPSDLDPENLASAAAWALEAALPNLRAPVALDVTARVWPLEAADAIFCANMIHIAPWEATLGLLAGAARRLGPGAPLILYGPYRFDGEFTAPSNARFDDSLRARDPRWGVRDLAAVEAAASGFALERVEALPANNHAVVFRRV